MAFQVDILGALKLSFVPFIIMLLINDFFGTLGTGLAMAGKAGLLDEDGNFPAFGKVFLVDSSATILGSLFEKYKAEFGEEIFSMAEEYGQ